MYAMSFNSFVMLYDFATGNKCILNLKLCDFINLVMVVSSKSVISKQTRVITFESSAVLSCYK